jgi:hypothetical protein
MGVNVGDRDREIYLQTATKARDTVTGEELADWDAIDPLVLYAEWLPGNSIEAYRAQQRLEAYIEGVFRIEPIDRPDPASQRIVWEGRIYDIVGVVEIERGDGWELAVTSRGAAEAATA